MTTGRSDNLQTVERALMVLQLFSARMPEWGLTEMADRLGIAKSMTHRLLSTLADYGFVTQDPRTRRYRLGLSLLGLGAMVGDQLRIRRVAMPYLEVLARETGETVFLMILDRAYAMVAARVEMKQTVNWVLGIGERSPLTAGASNKILLAYLPDEERDAILARFAAVGSPSDPVALRAELLQIQQRGWAFSAGEVTPLSAAVAVPIISQSGELLGGLSVAGPAVRFAADRIPELAAQAQESALHIARHYRAEGSVG